MDPTINFEYPGNEHMRLCLRLEHLFKQIQLFIHETSTLSHRLCVCHLLDLLNLLDRPDLRSKFSKQLHHYMTQLSRLNTAPHVDKTRLQQTLNEFDHLLTYIQVETGKFAQELRENAFLQSVNRHYQHTGVADFDTPGFYLWLHQKSNIRQQHLQKWLNNLSNIRTTITSVLTFIRGTYTPKEQIAHNGFYHQSLDPHTPCQLVRVTTNEQNIFPLISVGQHGLSIRFMQSNITEQANQVKTNLSFSLTCCNF